MPQLLGLGRIDESVSFFTGGHEGVVIGWRGTEGTRPPSVRIRINMLFSVLSVCLFVCLFACSLACLFACLFVCLLACLFACLFVCLLACLFVCSLVSLFLLFLSSGHSFVQVVAVRVPYPLC